MIIKDVTSLWLEYSPNSCYSTGLAHIIFKRGSISLFLHFNLKKEKKKRKSFLSPFNISLAKKWWFTFSVLSYKISLVSLIKVLHEVSGKHCDSYQVIWNISQSAHQNTDIPFVIYWVKFPLNILFWKKLYYLNVRITTADQSFAMGVLKGKFYKERQFKKKITLHINTEQTSYSLV